MGKYNIKVDLISKGDLMIRNLINKLNDTNDLSSEELLKFNKQIK